MTNTDDYYEILGVSKDATENDIKKSYYKLAREFHPDKAPSDKKEEYTKRFAKINEANEVLSDANKRQIYDQVGVEGLSADRNPFSQNGMNPFDMFPDIFGQMFGQGQARGRSRSNQSRKNKETIFQLKVSLVDAYKGTTKKLKITKTVVANKETKEPVDLKDLESTWSKCKKCEGEGQVVEIRQLGNMIQQTQRGCDKCSAKGVILKDKYMILEVTETLEIDVKKCVQDSEHIILEGGGNTTVGCLPGDLIIVFQVNDKHDLFKRHNNDLIYHHKILLSDALCGFSFKIKTLDDRTLFITCSDIIKPGSNKIIKGEGIKGADLKIEFEIIFPSQVFHKDKKRELLKLLPVPEKKVNKGNSDIEYKI